VLSLYGSKLRSLDIAVETRYETDILVNVFPGELRQVFSNLIINAADALEKSGTSSASTSSHLSTGRIPPKEGSALRFLITALEFQRRNVGKSLSRSTPR
jgi:nitrogen fixation/metabolism regulation signal transduction histidine kinase